MKKIKNKIETYSLWDWFYKKKKYIHWKKRQEETSFASTVSLDNIYNVYNTCAVLLLKGFF